MIKPCCIPNCQENAVRAVAIASQDIPKARLETWVDFCIQHTVADIPPLHDIDATLVVHSPSPLNNDPYRPSSTL